MELVHTIGYETCRTRMDDYTLVPCVRSWISREIRLGQYLSCEKLHVIEITTIGFPVFEPSPCPTRNRDLQSEDEIAVEEIRIGKIKSNPTTAICKLSASTHSQNPPVGTPRDPFHISSQTCVMTQVHIEHLFFSTHKL
jgi:hypothetical protein